MKYIFNIFNFSFLLLILISNTSFAITCAHEITKVEEIPLNSEFDFGNKEIGENGCTENFEMIKRTTHFYPAELGVGMAVSVKWVQGCNVCLLSKNSQFKGYIGKIILKSMQFENRDKYQNSPKQTVIAFDPVSASKTYNLYFESSQQEQFIMRCAPGIYANALGSLPASEVLDKLVEENIKCTPPRKERGSLRVISNPEDSHSFEE